MPEKDTQAYVYIDTETTSLDPAEGAMFQIGAVMAMDGIRLGEFSADFDPFTLKSDVVVNDKSLQKSGTLRETLTALPHHEEAYVSFVEWLKSFNLQSPPVFSGYNTSFDRGFLKPWIDANTAEPGQIEVLFAPAYKDNDLLSLARHLRKYGLIQTPNTQLGTIGGFFELYFDEHHALADARAVFQIDEAIKERLVSAWG